MRILSDCWGGKRVYYRRDEKRAARREGRQPAIDLLCESDGDPFGDRVERCVEL